MAWRRFADVPESDEARAWLLGVAYRVLANRRSASRRRMLLQKVARRGSNPALLSDEPVVRREEEAEAIAALSRLRAADREVLLLSLWEEPPQLKSPRCCISPGRPSISGTPGRSDGWVKSSAENKQSRDVRLV